jgi:hypothetical protein
MMPGVLLVSFWRGRIGVKADRQFWKSVVPHAIGGQYLAGAWQERACNGLALQTNATAQHRAGNGTTGRAPDGRELMSKHRFRPPLEIDRSLGPHARAGIHTVSPAAAPPRSGQA